MTIGAQTILQLSDFTIHVETDALYLSNDRHSFIPCDTDILGLLHLFSEPRTMADAASEPSMAHDWVRRTHAILSLVDAGILVARDGDSGNLSVGLSRIGFGGAREHISMLNDSNRTTPFINAIERTVKPGDIVVDLGTGTGVLAAAAARSGAALVHAIERSPIADAAELLFESNGLSDRVLLHRKTSSDAVLPEKGDVLISELIGNEPLSERVLEYVLDARHRLLKADARLVPRSMEIMGQCLALPDGLVDAHQFTPENTARWSRAYGFDFSPLQTLRTQQPLHVTVSPRTLNRCRPIGERVTILSIDFSSYTSTTITAGAELPVSSDGSVDAVHVSFRLHLDDEAVIENGCGQPGDESSWASRIWLPANPVVLSAGDTLPVTYRHSPIDSRLEFGVTA